MGNFKFSESAFLGREELNKLKEFLVDSGFRKQLLLNTVSFGIVRNDHTTQTNYFRIAKDDFANRTIRIQSGYGIDNRGYMLHSEGVSGIHIPDFDTWYWLKIKHKYTTFEKGVVNVSLEGNVTGIGTSFREVLRGQPNFPSVIRFYHKDGTLATSNGAITHEVQEVIDDTTLVLSTLDTVIETDLLYSVVGTFSPGINPTPTDEEIFEYDNIHFELVEETTLNTPPAFFAGENANNTFWIARVQKTSTDLFIEDKRESFWQTKSDFLLDFLPPQENVLIGVESIKFQSSYSPRDRNICYLSWAFKGESWAFNTSDLQVDVTSGFGGTYKNTSFVNSGDFNGWRLYISGQDAYFKIVSSSKPATNIVRLTLSNANPDVFTDTTQKLLITPDIERVGIKITSDNPIQEIEPYLIEFPVNIPTALFHVPVSTNDENAPAHTYKIQYRYANNYRYSPYLDIQDGDYYDEYQFDNNGVLIVPSVTTSYANALVTFQQAKDAYIKRLFNIDLTEIRGVNRTSLNNVTFFRDLILGQDKQYQYFENSAVAGIPFTPIGNQYINLKTKDATDAQVREGAEFYLHFTQQINLGGFLFQIRQDSDIATPSTTGTLLKEFTQQEVDRFTLKTGTFLRFIFDGNTWIYYQIEPFNIGSGAGSVPEISTSASLGANKIVETDGNSKLITANKNTAYNRDFGVNVGNVPAIGSDLTSNKIVETDGNSKLITANKNTAYNRDFGVDVGNVPDIGATLNSNEFVKTNANGKLFTAPLVIFTPSIVLEEELVDEIWTAGGGNVTLNTIGKVHDAGLYLIMAKGEVSVNSGTAQSVLSLKRGNGASRTNLFGLLSDFESANASGAIELNMFLTYVATLNPSAGEFFELKIEEFVGFLLSSTCILQWQIVRIA